MTAGRAVAFRARVVGAADGTLRIVRRGRIIYQIALQHPDQTFAFTEIPSAGDWYRVDVLVPVDWSLPFAGQGLALVANPNPASLSFLVSVIGVSVSIAANAPLLDFDDGYLRLVSADLGDPTMARAAITSPIYAR